MPKLRFKPKLKMVLASRRSLRQRRKFDRGGTPVAAERGHQRAERRDLSQVDVEAMNGFFARHAADRETKTHQSNSDSEPSAAFIAWLLWGGDAGRVWAERKTLQLDNQRES